MNHDTCAAAEDEPVDELSTSYAPSISRSHFGSGGYGSGLLAMDGSGSYSPMAGGDPNSPFSRDRDYKAVLMTPVGRRNSASMAGSADNSRASTPRAGLMPRRHTIVEVRTA
jgi:hypothetical protein